MKMNSHLTRLTKHLNICLAFRDSRDRDQRQTSGAPVIGGAIANTIACGFLDRNDVTSLITIRPRPLARPVSLSFQVSSNILVFVETSFVCSRVKWTTKNKQDYE